MRVERANRSQYALLTLFVAFLMILLSVFSVTIAGVATPSFAQSGSSTRTTTDMTAAGNTVSVATGWLTYHNNNGRDGYDASLPNTDSPSLSWKTKVDGEVYAEPLFFNGLVYVATENDTVYALNVATGTVQWREPLGTPANSTKPPLACPPNGPNITPTIGITGTPVIDPASDTMYVVALINGTGYRMFALNVNTGEVRWSSAISPGGFDYLVQEQRGALALANGVVYVPFGGYDWICGSINPNGWVVGVPQNDNGTQYEYKVPSSPEGDIWTPEGVSVDSSGFVYVVTGDSNNAAFDYGCTVIKLTPDLKTVVSYFAPPNWAYLNTNDIDLGSTGATLLPGNLVFSIGKDGVGYLLNSSNLGGIGGQLFSSGVCTFGYPGAWGSTSYANGIIYVPCGSGLLALSLQPGNEPTFSSLWNYTGIFAGPPIIAAGAVWAFDIYSGTLYALNPETGSLIFTLPPFVAPGVLPHFTTPSAGGGLVLFAEGATIYGLNPAVTCVCTTTSSTTSSLTTSSSHSSSATSTSTASSFSTTSTSSVTSTRTSSSASTTRSSTSSTTQSSSTSSSLQSSTSSNSPPPAPPPPSPTSSISPYDIFGLILVAIVLLALGAFLALRRQRRS